MPTGDVQCSSDRHARANASREYRVILSPTAHSGQLADRRGTGTNAAAGVPRKHMPSGSEAARWVSVPRALTDSERRDMDGADWRYSRVRADKVEFLAVSIHEASALQDANDYFVEVHARARTRARGRGQQHQQSRKQLQAHTCDLMKPVGALASHTANAKASSPTTGSTYFCIARDCPAVERRVSASALAVAASQFVHAWYSTEV